MQQLDARFRARSQRHGRFRYLKPSRNQFFDGHVGRPALWHGTDFDLDGRPFDGLA